MLVLALLLTARSCLDFLATNEAHRMVVFVGGAQSLQKWFVDERRDHDEDKYGGVRRMSKDGASTTDMPRRHSICTLADHDPGPSVSLFGIECGGRRAPGAVVVASRLPAQRPGVGGPGHGVPSQLPGQSVAGHIDMPMRSTDEQAFPHAAPVHGIMKCRRSSWSSTKTLTPPHATACPLTSGYPTSCC